MIFSFLKYTQFFHFPETTCRSSYVGHGIMGIFEVGTEEFVIKFLKFRPLVFSVFSFQLAILGTSVHCTDGSFGEHGVIPAEPYEFGTHHFLVKRNIVSDNTVSFFEVFQEHVYHAVERESVVSCNFGCETVYFRCLLGNFKTIGINYEVSRGKFHTFIVGEYPAHCTRRGQFAVSVLGSL